MREISKSDDTIDSRDVIKRISELESDLEHQFGLLEECGDDAERRAVHTQAMDEISAELRPLLELAAEAEGYAPDWQYGAQLIRDTYFVEAMQELCADIGDVPKDMPGYLVIDWEATAENLRADYTSVEFDGVTYWVR